MKNYCLLLDNAAGSIVAYRLNDFECKLCKRRCINAHAWETHLTSKHHMMLAKRIQQTGKPDFVPPKPSIKNVLKSSLYLVVGLNLFI